MAVVLGYARAFATTNRSYAAISSVRVWTRRSKGSNAGCSVSGQASVAFRANVSVGDAGNRCPVDFTIPPHSIHDLRARLDGHLAGPDQREIELSLGRPRMNGGEESRSHMREAR